MLDRVTRFILTRFLRKAPKESTCTNCHQSYPSPRTYPDYGIDAVITCPHCQHRSSLLVWAKENPAFKKGSARSFDDDPWDPHPPAPVEKPLDSSITRLEAPDGSVVWNIPRTGKSGGLLFFAIFWNAISWAITLAFFFSGSILENPVAIPLVLVFPAIGLALLYFALRNRYATHLLGVSASTVMLDRSFFGRKKRFRLQADLVDSAQMKVFYQQNYEPIYGIEIRSPKGKIRFGSALNDDEKQWLVQEIRDALGISPNDSRVAPTSQQQKIKDYEKKRQKKKGLQVEQLGKSITITSPPQPIQYIFLVIGLVFLAATAFLFYQSFSSLARVFSGDHDDAIVIVVELLFGIVPFVMGLVFGAISLLIIGVGIFRINNGSTLVVAPQGADWSRRKPRSPRDQRHLHRSEISAVRVVRCPYEVNNVPSYRGEIVGPDFVLPFGFYSNPEKLHATAQSIRQTLNLPTTNPHPSQ